MRILLTGATGFVGQAFLRSISSKDQVVCLSRSEPKNSQPNVSFVETDLSVRDSVMRAAGELSGEFDVLVHLAAYVPKQGIEDNLQDSSHVNIDGTVNLLEAFGGRVKRIVVGSTVEVYDQSKLSGKITEDSAVGAASYYGSTKLASEFIAVTYGKKELVPLIVLRFSVMYGPDDPIARALPNFIKAALKNEPIIVNGGNKLRDYISVDDVARSIHAAISSPATGFVNIGSGRGVTIRDAVHAIIAEIGSSSMVTFENDDAGSDIVIETRRATELINFTAVDIFPDKLNNMIESYR